MSEWIFIAFLFLVIVTSIVILFFVIRDLYEIFEAPNSEKRIRQLQKAKQPSVTVLVYAHNNEDLIEATLKSLVKSNYYRYDIVVVNDRSKDQTATRTKEFISKHPKVAINLLNRHVKKSTDAALKAGYVKSSHGDIVISLRAGAIVQPAFIKQAVATKGEHDYIRMHLKEKINTNSLSTITETLGNFLWQYSHEVHVGNVSNITTAKVPVQLNLLTSLLFIIISASVFVMNAAIIFWYVWILVTSYLCAIIWLNNENILTKIKLTFSALPSLFLLPVASLVQGISQLRSRN